MAKITGTNLNDVLIGTDSADSINGYGGDDVLEGRAGNDTLYGGAGNDILRAFSWGGEPVAAQDGTKINGNEPVADTDYLVGGSGKDTFEIRWLIDAKYSILEKNRDPDSGYVDYNAKTGGVASENANSHDHWVETQGIGTKIIADYNENEDTLLFHGHTVLLKSLSHKNGDTVLDFYSRQGGGGAHNGDDVGTVIVKGVLLDKSDIDVNPGVFFGVETAEVFGTTGTGLDRIVDFIVNDAGLNEFSNSPSDEIVEGAKAADGMNQILVKAIKATGAANDGVISTSEVREFTDYVQKNHYGQWVQLHGNDNPETGFHLVRSDPQTTRYDGLKAIDTVSDGIFHIGFGYYYDQVRNEDGKPTATQVKDVAGWLNDLLEVDLANGSLKNGGANTGGANAGGANTGGADTGGADTGGADTGGADTGGADTGGANTGGANTAGAGNSGTGLDQLVQDILDDPYLNQTMKTSQIQVGAQSAEAMNDLIVEGIEETGVANNGVINAADVRELDAYIKSNHYNELVQLHGDDNPDSGFHAVRDASYFSKAQLFGEKAIYTVADSIYHTGFGHHYVQVRDQDGKVTATTVEDVGDWLTGLLDDELADGDLNNQKVNPYDVGSTGTGLDKLVETIFKDPGLNLKIKTSDIHEGAEAAHKMNEILIAGIKATDAADYGRITADEVRGLDAYIRQNHLGEWTQLHGDDENGVETGFHSVQGDGATTRLYGNNAVNTVADSLYHIGFGTHYIQLKNEDGNPTASTVQDAANWLNNLLSDDLDDGSLLT